MLRYVRLCLASTQPLETLLASWMKYAAILGSLQGKQLRATLGTIWFLGVEDSLQWQQEAGALTTSEGSEFCQNSLSELRSSSSPDKPPSEITSDCS